MEDWIDCVFIDGRLYDNETGDDLNSQWAYFDDEAEAGQYLIDHDIRATII